MKGQKTKLVIVILGLLTLVLGMALAAAAANTPDLSQDRGQQSGAVQ